MSLKIQRSENQTSIQLSKALDSRAKLLHLFYAGMFFTMMFAVLLLLIEVDRMGFAIFALAAAVIISVLGARFLNKALETETVVLEKETLTILKTGFLRKSVRVFPISEIENLKYVQEAPLTDHPLAGKTFDYLGFQTEQQVINNMHGHNAVEFTYRNAQIGFGQNLASWDADELRYIIGAHLG